MRTDVVVVLHVVMSLHPPGETQKPQETLLSTARLPIEI